MTHTNLYPRGAIYYVDLGEPDGTSIQAGIRPCLLTSSDINNKHSPNLNIISLTSSSNKTSRGKGRLPIHIYITAEESGLPKDSICLCEQQRTVPKTALRGYITTLSDETMARVSEGLRIQLSL